jgi:simple sugar transport system permease protein
MLFVAIGICVAFRGGMTNVGGEGQMIMGALAGVSVVLAFSTEASWWVIPLAVIAGFIAGGLYGALAGWLKAFFSVNEILSTIMLNAIAVQVMNFLLNGPLLDPSEAGVNNIPKTARIAETLQIPRLSIPIPQGLADLFTFENAELFARTRLHWGFVLAVILAVVAYYLLWRTTIGYRIRAVGENDRAARFAGMRVRWNMVLSMFISGGFAGLAGVVQVLGLVYRLQTDGSPTGFTGNAGFNGIVVALLGGLNPIGAIFASVFFGGLLVGAQKMQRDLGVPASLITAINGLIVIFVVCSEYFVRWRARRKALAKTGPPAMTEPVPVPRASELTAGQPSP